MAEKKTVTSRGSSAPVESDLQRHSQELGYFGVWFGSKDNAAVYIAGLLAFIALLGAVAVGVWGRDPSGDLSKALLAIVVSALSFIGGISGRGNGK